MPDGKSNATQPGKHPAVRGDNPIRRSEDDTLRRASAASSFAKQVLEIDASEGAVVGVLGPWGSGKTSFVNLARPHFDQAGVPVLDFNPWMFSGAQQLVESFFIELSAQLKLRPSLTKVAEALAAYGELFSGLGWIPVVGSWIERLRMLASAVGKSVERRKEGVAAQRKKVEHALARLDKPIIICVDDIDRLSTQEIRDIFKLVRLTASFPNLIYVVAFDRERVEKALEEQGVPGRDYLEKILQLVVDLPVVPDEVLMGRLLSEVDSALADVENRGPFNQNLWADIFSEIVRPLIHNMRDVRRYAAAVRGTVIALEGQVALADVLALETVRVFLPDVFRVLNSAVAGLTTTATWADRHDTPELKAQIDLLLKSGGKDSKPVRAMIDRLFPAAQRHVGGSTFGLDWKGRWLRARRVAHEDILRFYLEKVAGRGLRNFRDAEQAFGRLEDPKVLDQYLRAVDKDRLQDVIASLEVYEDQFKPGQVIPAT
ncbi:MAG: P-loop NTPase fold protein, partial [Candidatus Acidiferrum sp.]